MCIDVAFLETKGLQRDVGHKESTGALVNPLATAEIHPECINFAISDEGSTMVAAAKGVLQHVSMTTGWMCWCHKLATLGDILGKRDVFSIINLVSRSSPVIQVPMHCSQRRRSLERSSLENVPSNIGDTGWTLWQDGANDCCEVVSRGRTLR